MQRGAWVHNCTFCAEVIRNSPDTDFQATVGVACPERILKQTKHFIVIPTVGQIIEGYRLVVSREHFLSAVHIPLGCCYNGGVSVCRSM
jgi:hypothetical protein